jgi:hypothetical protein
MMEVKKIQKDTGEMEPIWCGAAVTGVLLSAEQMAM